MTVEIPISTNPRPRGHSEVDFLSRLAVDTGGEPPGRFGAGDCVSGHSFTMVERLNHLVLFAGPLLAVSRVLLRKP